MARKILKCLDPMTKYGYDPMEELIKTRAELVKRIEYQDDVRDGKIVRLNSGGKERYYNEEMHMKLYDQLTKIDDALMRYKYARVPETTNIRQNTMPLVIKLTPKGEEYRINEDEEMSDANTEDFS